MRQLWVRIRDYVLLAAFIIISMVVMVRQNDPVFRVMRAFSLETTSRVEGRFALLGRYLGALRENDALRSTNVSLSGQLALLRRAELENRRLKMLLGLRDSLQFPTVAARVISKDVTRQKNTLTLDVGRRNGVAAGMPVIDDNGIIGKVIFASDRYSRVQSVFNTDFRVPAEVEPANAFGIVRWEGRGRTASYLLLEYVVKTVPVQKGDRVVTSSSLSFPPGLTIGTVDSVIVQPGQNELRIFLRPSTPVGEARYAFVVQTLPDSELVRVNADGL